MIKKEEEKKGKRNEKYRKGRLINARREREREALASVVIEPWTLTSFARCIRAAKRYNHEDCSLCLFVRSCPLPDVEAEMKKRKKELIFFAGGTRGAKCAQKIFGAREMTAPRSSRLSPR